MNQIQPHQPNRIQTWIIVAAILYWISPIDFLPLIPIDDIIVMVFAMALSSLLGVPNNE